MVLKSGADVKIGEREFFLDNSVEEPYARVLESLYSDTQDITGMDAKTANPNVLLWTYDDFAGGGENKFYSDTIPDTYWKGNANSRQRGSITAPPDTSATTLTLTDSSPPRWFTVSVGGRIWAAAGRDLFYSTDGASWSQWNATALFPAGYVIDGMTDDGARPWVSASNGSARKTKRINSTTTEETAISDFSSGEALFGMAMLEGQIYMWTGAKLYQYDSTLSLPLTNGAANMVHQPFANSGVYGGITATESSIVYFTSAAGITNVFEWRFSSTVSAFVPRPIWRPAPGFTCRFISASMGVIYLLGDYISEVAILGMSQVNREPLFLSYVGQAYGGEAGATLTPTALSPSYGSSMLVGIKDSSKNYYFVYDAEIDAMTALDQFAHATDGQNGAMATFVNKRVAIGNNSDTTARFRSWSMDFATPTRAWDWDSAAYNIGYPMDEKLLFGFEVVQDPKIAAGTISVYYQIDEDDTWVLAGTTPAGQKYTYLDLSANNVKFRNLRMRMVGAGGARCFSITARSYLNSYQELWRLVVKLRDEKPNSRPTARQAKAEVLREWLNELATAKDVVTFLDGRTKPGKGKFTTHRVVVEFPRYGGSRIHRSRGHYEGSAEIVLRSTAVASSG
jgi:hypothetical protein